MLVLIIAIIVGLAVLFASDHIGRKKIVSEELSRKIPHVVAALTFAALPFLINPKLVTYSALLLFVGAVVANKLNWFAHARRINRKSWGDIFSPAGILAASVLTDSKWVFAAAMLNLGIADTLAALIGKRFGGKHTYKVAGQTKSLAGSLAFWVASVLITALALQQLDISAQMFWPIIFWLPLALTAAENAGVYGLDNLTIPVLVVATLNFLQFA